MMITTENLRAVYPKVSRADEYAEALNKGMPRFQINTQRRMAAFIAQVMHESAGFSRLEENLNYSAARLMLVWPKRFSSIDIAKRYERRPEVLANIVYADRMGNGNEASGDGWRYRGRGPMQITGRSNYERCGRALGFDLITNPDMLLTPTNGVLAAAWFWADAGCNALADRGDFDAITQRINGGQNGASERKDLHAAAITALNNNTRGLA